jgi:hypothetical protein
LSISSKHQAALDYAASGIPVFPCIAGGKAPATTHGFKDATTDETQINAWWGENPEYNIAFQPNTVGWCVIDLDGQEGIAAWATLQREQGSAPQTYTVTTPRGGKHLYFEGELPTSAWRPGVKRALGEHIDTRGIGSYVLIPPSTVEGKSYVVTSDLDLARVPDWCAPVLDRRAERKSSETRELDEQGSVARATQWLRDCVGRGHVAISGRGGNSCTYQLAASLYELGLSRDKAYELTAEIWNPACIPPWGSGELATIFDNAASYVQNEPGAYAARPASETFAEALASLPAESDPQAGRARFFPKGFNDPEYDSGVQPTPFDPNAEERQPVPLETIVEGWIEKGVYIPLIGPGGTHKSRIMLQLALSHMYGRQFLQPNLARDFTDKSERLTHVEFLNYENSSDEMDRRSFAMHKRLALKPDDYEGTFNRWDFRNSREPLVYVKESGINLTRVGERFLTRLEGIRAHKLVILDSFFNAIEFGGKSKVMDDCALATVQMLDHWCRILNCTIVAPFHPSRAGVQRGDTGYSPAFEDRVRQALSISELQPKKRGETVPADVYKLAIQKWNNGPRRSINLRYDGGPLMLYTPDVEAQED